MARCAFVADGRKNTKGRGLIRIAIYVYDSGTRRACLSTRALQEESGAEYASYDKGGENGTQEAHAEPAVLYRSLVPLSEDGEDGFRIFITPMGGQGESEEERHERPSSRCEQYGGHWKGRMCVGVPHHGGGINITRICEGVGSAAVIGIVAKQALGPAGTAVTVACGVYGGVRLVKEILH